MTSKLSKRICKETLNQDMVHFDIEPCRKSDMLLFRHDMCRVLKWPSLGLLAFQLIGYWIKCIVD